MKLERRKTGRWRRSYFRDSMVNLDEWRWEGGWWWGGQAWEWVSSVLRMYERRPREGGREGGGEVRKKGGGEGRRYEGEEWDV